MVIMTAVATLLLQPGPIAGPQAPESERAAIFAAAGYRRVGAAWVGSCDDPGTASYEPPVIDLYHDINGDGQADAVVVEGSAFCYGNIGQSFAIVSRQADGSWRFIHRDVGYMNMQATRGEDGWPDLEVGGPGFCFPVLRWNGTAYQLHRRAYNGRPCR